MKPKRRPPATLTPTITTRILSPATTGTPFGMATTSVRIEASEPEDQATVAGGLMLDARPLWHDGRPKGSMRVRVVREMANPDRYAIGFDVYTDHGWASPAIDVRGEDVSYWRDVDEDDARRLLEYGDLLARRLRITVEAEAFRATKSKHEGRARRSPTRPGRPVFDMGIPISAQGGPTFENVLGSERSRTSLSCREVRADA